jgi:hypothetical protein
VSAHLAHKPRRTYEERIDLVYPLVLAAAFVYLLFDVLPPVGRAVLAVWTVAALVLVAVLVPFVRAARRKEARHRG